MYNGPVLDFLDPNSVETVNSVSESKKVSSVTSKSSFTLPVTLSQGKEIRIQTTALVDSGAYAVFVNYRFVHKHKLKTQQLATPIEVYNADGSRN